ncbi:unnamed protein product [Dimorphilus gyrociliatus]|uniref:Uncharacterized protein n=1 Tax=Dimorphilus gyrociliatus TaxID=2664684 RepID=A0A7I8WEM2_9ANNE|nr:unnamed protein product [Dimorphilus gyrociliatus]
MQKFLLVLLNIILLQTSLQTLLLNEINYEQDYIEIKNVGSSAVDLTPIYLSVIVLKGGTPTMHNPSGLHGSIQPNDFHVIQFDPVRNKRAVQLTLDYFYLPTGGPRAVLSRNKIEIFLRKNLTNLKVIISKEDNYLTGHYLNIKFNNFNILTSVYGGLIGDIGRKNVNVIPSAQSHTSAIFQINGKYVEAIKPSNQALSIY